MFHVNHWRVKFPPPCGEGRRERMRAPGWGSCCHPTPTAPNVVRRRRPSPSRGGNKRTSPAPHFIDVSRESLAGNRSPFHVKRRVNLSFTNAEVFENLVKHVLDADPAGDAPERTGGQPQLLGDELFWRRRRGQN